MAQTHVGNVLDSWLSDDPAKNNHSENLSKAGFEALKNQQLFLRSNIYGKSESGEVAQSQKFSPQADKVLGSGFSITDAKGDNVKPGSEQAITSVQMNKSEAAPEKPVSLVGLLDQHTGPNSVLAQTLRSRGIAMNGDGETQMGIRPDGSVYKYEKLSNNHSATTICRENGTVSQRVTDHRGQEVLRLSNGQMVENKAALSA